MGRAEGCNDGVGHTCWQTSKAVLAGGGSGFTRSFHTLELPGGSGRPFTREFKI